jgi:ubiquinone/menaquinone biosynthesis C-methylase UbiE
VAIFARPAGLAKRGMSHPVAAPRVAFAGVAATRTDESYVPALAFHRLTGLFDPVVRVTMRERRFRPRLLEQAAIGPRHRVLDVGCGTATLAIMAKRREPTAEVVGLDGDPAILERGRAKAAQAGADVRLDRGMSFDLPYEDASFDRVLSSLFFHHLKPDAKERTAREIARVLKPGGELHVADFGTAADPLQAALFGVVRRFDGEEETRDNARGLLPTFFERAGLADARARGTMRTLLGTLAFYSARRP